MSPENTEKLFNRYPDLYASHQDGPRKSLMCFGFECGDGWFDLIDALSRKITEISPETAAVQVKEKFATLRFYIGSATDDVFDIIELYEDVSGHICEECGAPGRMRDGGSWLKTRCDGCQEYWEIKQLGWPPVMPV